ncbi:pterin 4 alpha carbinolamine dehydratase-domain-containing protein [Chaetomium strumarium]|uniref:4a-hydroxytetrahydrobiopterin dehydratase n=1 Tax=Chaetomium strumarium TaxID=1170767 RepID=A0AAJ0GW00_9PEZI|nr:pterin 4 alpha carbinolamine dehydratase-domain-containing protein [Chaetomium strumarium]
MRPSLLLLKGGISSTAEFYSQRTTLAPVAHATYNLTPRTSLRPAHHRNRSSTFIIRHLTRFSPRNSKMNNSSSLPPRFSTGSDPAALETSLAPLLTTSGGRWTLAAEGEALEREFKFKTFAKTWDFMTAVALQCKLKNHHPEWSNVFNTTFIRWTTHHPKGLSAKDIELAAICDALAKDFGEIPIEQAQGQQQGAEQGEQSQQACGLSGLANRAVGSAGDCCVPKTAR